VRTRPGGPSGDQTRPGSEAALLRRAPSTWPFPCEDRGRPQALGPTLRDAPRLDRLPNVSPSSTSGDAPKGDDVDHALVSPGLAKSAEARDPVGGVPDLCHGLEDRLLIGTPHPRRRMRRRFHWTSCACVRARDVSVCIRSSVPEKGGMLPRRRELGCRLGPYVMSEEKQMCLDRDPFS